MLINQLSKRPITKNLNFVNTKRFCSPLINPTSFTNLYTGDADLGNTAMILKPLSDRIQPDFMVKLAEAFPGSLYNNMDVFSREALLYAANDLGLGIGVGILSISLLIKFIFMPIAMKAQVNAIKMKLLEPESKNFQDLMRQVQKSGNQKAVKEVQSQYMELRRKHGIKNSVIFLSLGQVPVLITWFLSLRYVTSFPEKFPGIRTEGLLWFQDLSVPDPYYILPVLSAYFSFLSISLNPNMSSGSANPFGKYIKYFRFVPFMTVPVVVFFPSGLTLYWVTIAFTQLILVGATRSTTFKQMLKVPEYLPGTILEKLNQKNQIKVVKTVIVDKEPEQQKKVERQEKVKEKSKEIQEESKQDEQTDDSSKVKVFLHNPKKGGKKK